MKQVFHKAKKLFSSQGGGSTITIDTDPTLAANSDTIVASQKAVKAYIDKLSIASKLYLYNNFH